MLFPPFNRGLRRHILDGLFLIAGEMVRLELCVRTVLVEEVWEWLPMKSILYNAKSGLVFLHHNALSLIDQLLFGVSFQTGI